MRKLLNKLKIFIQSYKFSNIKNSIEEMGFSITSRLIGFYILVAFFLSFFVGTILKLNLMYSLIVVLFFVLCIPKLIIYRYKFHFEKQKFTDIVNYMERLIYAYQKSGKLYTALEDVKAVSGKRLQRQIQKALNFIDNGKAKENLYKEALSFIEKKNNCTRLQTLHNYLIDVELNGGDSTTSLNLLTDDIRAWSIRMQTYQTDRNNIKGKIIISIILAISTCVAALFLVPSEYSAQMIVKPLYQIGTAMALIAYIIVFIYVEKIAANSYLDLELDEINYKSYLRALKRVEKFNASLIIKKSVLCLVIAIGCCFLAHIIHLDLMMIPIVLVFAIIAYQPICINKNDKKTILKEINKAFPVWIRNMVLLLQINNVSVSIQESLKTCPLVLKPHVEKLLKGIEENPASSKPFDDFRKEYDIPDIKLTVNFLYYLSNFGSDEMLGQLDYIIKQNDHLTLNEERIRNEDSLSMMSMLILAPMAISILKLVLDMYSLLGVMSLLFSSDTIID